MAASSSPIRLPAAYAKSARTLRFIISSAPASAQAPEEAGSQAAELTLLLRRVLHTFGCHPGNVHFIATSATLGEAVHQTLVQANLLGFGDKYIASLMEAQEKLAGVTIVRR